MKKFNNLMLYISVFIPLYILILIKTLFDFIFGNLSFNVLNLSLTALLLILLVLGLIGVLNCIKDEKIMEENITVLCFKNITDQHFLNYFSLFVLFAITFDLSKVSYSIVFVIILVFIGIVYIKNELYYINPFLNIIGYSFYEITFKKNNDNKIYFGKVFCINAPTQNKTYKAILKQNGLWFFDMNKSKSLNEVQK